MKVHDNLLKDLGRVFFWYVLRLVANLLPFSTLRFLGRVTGDFDYYLFKKRAERIKLNLLCAFKNTLSDKTASEIVKKILFNHYALILEFFKYPQIDENNLGTIIEIEGIKNLDYALSLKRGAILGHGHFGSKFLLIISLGLKGYKINQIAYHMPKAKLTFIRESFPTGIIPEVMNFNDCANAPSS